MQNSFYIKHIKKKMDFVFALFGVLILLPLFFLVSIIIKLTSKGKIIYIQKRVGQNFKEFNLYKFRSMINSADKKGIQVTTKTDKRITSFGRILRKTKLDELPQLFNVLKGDMSFVGPRPEVLKYINYYKKDYKKILTIKPGITDFAAIEFRDEENLLSKYQNVEKAYIEIILPKKIKLYKQYLKKISFLTDLKLIFQTLREL